MPIIYKSFNGGSVKGARPAKIYIPQEPPKIHEPPKPPTPPTERIARISFGDKFRARVQQLDDGLSKVGRGIKAVVATPYVYTKNLSKVAIGLPGMAGKNLYRILHEKVLQGKKGRAQTKLSQAESIDNREKTLHYKSKIDLIDKKLAMRKELIKQNNNHFYKKLNPLTTFKTISNAPGLSLSKTKRKFNILNTLLGRVHNTSSNNLIRKKEKELSNYEKAKLDVLKSRVNRNKSRISKTINTYTDKEGKEVKVTVGDILNNKKLREYYTVILKQQRAHGTILPDKLELLKALQKQEQVKSQVEWQKYHNYHKTQAEQLYNNLPSQEQLIKNKTENTNTQIKKFKDAQHTLNLRRTSSIKSTRTDNISEPPVTNLAQPVVEPIKQPVLSSGQPSGLSSETTVVVSSSGPPSETTAPPSGLPVTQSSALSGTQSSALLGTPAPGEKVVVVSLAPGTPRPRPPALSSSGPPSGTKVAPSGQPALQRNQALPPEPPSGQQVTQQQETYNEKRKQIEVNAKTQLKQVNLQELNNKKTQILNKVKQLATNENTRKHRDELRTLMTSLGNIDKQIQKNTKTPITIKQKFKNLFSSQPHENARRTVQQLYETHKTLYNAKKIQTQLNKTEQKQQKPLQSSANEHKQQQSSANMASLASSNAEINTEPLYDDRTTTHESIYAKASN